MKPTTKPKMVTDRNQTQERLILEQLQRLEKDPSSSPGMRDFRRKQIAEYERTIARREIGRVKPPSAFEAFLTKLEK